MYSTQTFMEYLSFSIITVRNYDRSLYYSSQLAIILQQWPLPFFATTSAYENFKGEIPPARHSQTIATSLKPVWRRRLYPRTYTTIVSVPQSDNRGTHSRINLARVDVATLGNTRW